MQFSSSQGIGTSGQVYPSELENHTDASPNAVYSETLTAQAYGTLSEQLALVPLTNDVIHA